MITMERMQEMTEEQSKMIFVSSCIEATARQEGTHAQGIYSRMMKVGMIDHYIIPNYELLHTQSRQYITDICLKTLHNWEAAGASMNEKGEQA